MLTRGPPPNPAATTNSACPSPLTSAAAARAPPRKLASSIPKKSATLAKSPPRYTWTRDPAPGRGRGLPTAVGRRGDRRNHRRHDRRGGALRGDLDRRREGAVPAGGGRVEHVGAGRVVHLRGERPAVRGHRVHQLDHRF